MPASKVPHLPRNANIDPETGRFRPIPLAERFWLRVDRRGDEVCWEWQGVRYPNGYGSIRGSASYRDGRDVRRSFLTHRVAYEIANGPIPDGLIVRHTCDNPPCVNPKHLLLGTYKDNNRDMHERGRAADITGVLVGERNGAVKLTSTQVLEIRQSYVPYKMTRKNLAAKYGVSSALIDKILSGEAWGHLPVRPKAPRTTQPRLTAAQADSIRRRYSEGGISQARIALEFGVSQSLVSQIVTGKVWNGYSLLAMARDGGAK